MNQLPFKNLSLRTGVLAVCSPKVTYAGMQAERIHRREFHGLVGQNEQARPQVVVTKLQSSSLDS
jgi:hypothetical protein